MVENARKTSLVEHCAQRHKAYMGSCKLALCLVNKWLTKVRVGFKVILPPQLLVCCNPILYTNNIIKILR